MRRDVDPPLRDGLADTAAVRSRCRRQRRNRAATRRRARADDAMPPRRSPTVRSDLDAGWRAVPRPIASLDDVLARSRHAAVRRGDGRDRPDLAAGAAGRAAARDRATAAAIRAGDIDREATALLDLAARCRALADQMPFGFLYDRTRHLFSIGYRLADADGPGVLDPSFYDLLASEARLASFIAIARGDVPQRHWFHLGRRAVSVEGVPTLLSWSATMFEYLMPSLLMRSFPGTLLETTNAGAVVRQIQYGTAARRAVGHLRVGLQRPRPARHVPVPGVRRPRPRVQARPGRRPGGRAVCDGAGAA